MEGVTIPTAVPDDLRKACDSLVKRATEVKRSEPVIAYWCCFAAAQNALKIPNRSAQGTNYLLSLLDALEQMKAVLANNDAVAIEAAGSAYVENFALRIFVSADNDERKGKFDRSVIQRFAVSAQFMDVLRCFEGGLSEEMEQKRKYALWKAADLSKCLREGRKPVPGPPVSEEDEQLAALAAEIPAPPSGDTSRRSSNTSKQSSGEHSRRGSSSGPKPPPIVIQGTGSASPPGPAPHPLKRSDSSQWSTVATPGVDGDGEPWPHSEIPRPTAASPPAQPKPSRVDMPEKNVRFKGPDGAPLSPAETFASVSEFNEVGAPPPSEAGAPPPPLVPAALPKPVIPAPKPPAKPASPPKTSPPVKPTPQPAPRPVVSAQRPVVSASRPVAPTPTPPPGARLGRRETELVQKHARWAISAMDYDDYETARKELLLALNMLPPPSS